MKILLILVAIAIIQLASSCTLQDEANWFRKNDTNTSYSGIIARKYLDPDRRDQPMFILEDSEKFDFYNIDIFKIAEPGDSIVKIAGTLKRTLKKKNRSISFYPTCCKDMVIEDSIIVRNTSSGSQMKN